MRKRINVLILGLAMCLGASNASAVLEVSASFQVSARADFYAPLGGLGTWIEVQNYGRCWRPSGVAMEWRPYCDGQWVWTDCGWYWESNEPWGWACYHYGRWIDHPALGWVWMPDVEWAPAWVSWRVGGGYCGWAPMAPVGFAITPSFFTFVEARHFREPVRRSTVIVNNTTIINRTTQITNVRQETRRVGGNARRVMVNEGPGLAPIQKASNKRIREVPIRDVAGRSAPPRGAIRQMREPAGTEKPIPAPREPARPEIRRTPSERSAPPTHEVAPPPGRPPVETTRPETRTAPAERSAPPPTHEVAPPPGRPPVETARPETRTVPPKRSAPPAHEPAPHPNREPVETAPAPHRPEVRPGSGRPPEERGRDHKDENENEKSHGNGRDKP